MAEFFFYGLAYFNVIFFEIRRVQCFDSNFSFQSQFSLNPFSILLCYILIYCFHRTKTDYIRFIQKFWNICTAILFFFIHHFFFHSHIVIFNFIFILLKFIILKSILQTVQRLGSKKWALILQNQSLLKFSMLQLGSCLQLHHTQQLVDPLQMRTTDPPYLVVDTCLVIQLGNVFVNDLVLDIFRDHYSKVEQLSHQGQTVLLNYGCFEFVHN